MYRIKLEIEKKTYDFQLFHCSCYNLPPATGEDEHQAPVSQDMNWNVRAAKADQKLPALC